MGQEAQMPHRTWQLLLSFWTTSLALFTLAADSNAQETLRAYAPPILQNKTLTDFAFGFIRKPV